MSGVYTTAILTGMTIKNKLLSNNKMFYESVNDTVSVTEKICDTLNYTIPAGETMALRIDMTTSPYWNQTTGKTICITNVMISDITSVRSYQSIPFLNIVFKHGGSGGKPDNVFYLFLTNIIDKDVKFCPANLLLGGIKY